MSKSETGQKPRAVEITTEGGVVMATIVGPVIEAHRADAIRTTLGPAMEDLGGQLKCLVLDLGEVNFVNSSGIGICIEMANAARRLGARTLAYCPDENVLDTFRRVRADHLIRFATTANGLEQMLAS